MFASFSKFLCSFKRKTFMKNDDMMIETPFIFFPVFVFVIDDWGGGDGKFYIFDALLNRISCDIDLLCHL